MKTQKYKKSPIIEVVCEFRFELENESDATLPGMYFSLVKEKFPIKKQRSLGTMVPIEGSKGEAEMVVSHLAQFYNQEETQLIQIGSNLLSINCLKNYPFWENFSQSIMEIFTKYLEVAKPKAIKRIALKSINKIEIANQTFELPDYFKFFPASPNNIETPVKNFSLHIETSLNDGRDILAMKNVSTISDNIGNSAFILDFEYIMNKPGGVELNEVENWLEIALEQLYRAFDESITEKLKLDFEPIDI